MNPTLKLVKKNRDEVMSVAELLYGDGAWEISKALTQTGQPSTRKQNFLRGAALTSTAAGAALGVSEVGEGLRDVTRAGGTLNKIASKIPKIPASPKVRLGVATTMLGGDALATSELKKPKQPKIGPTPTTVTKLYSTQRPARTGELRQLRADHPVASKLRPKKYSSGWVYQDDDGNKTIDAGSKRPNIGPTKVTKGLLSLKPVNAAVRGVRSAEQKASQHNLRAWQNEADYVSARDHGYPSGKPEAYKVASDDEYQHASQSRVHADEHQGAAYGAAKKLRRNSLAVGATGGLAVGGGAGYASGRKRVKKSAPREIEWRGEISKMDNDKRQVFGWASIVEVNGEPVVDLQGDYLSVDEIEKAAYDYVRKSRVGGNQHQKGVHVSDMIESFLVTPEKKQQMGLPADTPTGWWVGFQVNDDDTWQQVKRGERKEFSIHGSGIRKDVEL